MKKQIGIFLLITFGFTWISALWMHLSGIEYGSFYAIVIMSCWMLSPAMASILTRLITGEGFKNMMLKPQFRGNRMPYLIAWFLPAGLILSGALIYFLLFRSQFDPTLSFLTVQASITSVTEKNMIFLFFLQACGGLFLIGPIVNLIPTLGEELGWRGYLLPRLNAMFGRKDAILFSGIVWGIWHAPAIAMGHNYGVGYLGAPWTGILMMTLFCIATGAILSYLAFQTESVIPCAIYHSGINASASLPIVFCQPGFNPLIGPFIMGAVGMIPTIAFAFYFYYKSIHLKI